jgi:hypothetical protein
MAGNRGLVSFAAGQKQEIANALLKFLERPDAAGRLMTAMGGFMFEDWLCEEAKRLGLWVENVSHKRLPYDLVVNGYRVQLKSSGAIDGRVDVRPVRPVVGSTVRRYSQQDFDILAVHLASFDEVFIVPTSEFQCPVHIGCVRGSFYRNEALAWIDAWHVLETGSGCVRRQQRLFSM